MPVQVSCWFINNSCPPALSHNLGFANDGDVRIRDVCKQHLFGW